MRFVFVLALLAAIAGCNDTSKTQSHYATHRLSDGLCMVELACTHSVKLECLLIAPKGETEVQWTEVFHPASAGDNNQFFVRFDEQELGDISVTRVGGFTRSISTEGLGELEWYSPGSNSTFGSQPKPKFVWFAAFAPEAKERTMVINLRLLGEEQVIKLAQEQSLNILLIRASESEL